LRSPTVVLFDIDGTLVDCGGAGKRSMERAFAELFDVPEPFIGLSFGGMTDRAIIRHGLGVAGQRDDEATIGQVLQAYLATLRASLPSAATFRVIDGAPRGIHHARALGHAVGLGTGNVREGALLKLERGGLGHGFDFGGFGCDSEDRAALLEVGARRGAERLGRPRSACKILVVGDTPRDVRAAHAIGADCLAVTTGRFDAASLSAEGAELVARALDAPEALAFFER
jgi:phosphoglycolate phosphatase-like HAD superfamily hydrolase